jgi:hypothetical protein
MNFDSTQPWNIVFSQKYTKQIDPVILPCQFVNTAILINVSMDIYWKKAGYLQRIIPSAQFGFLEAESYLIRNNENKFINYPYAVTPYFQVKFSPLEWVLNFTISLWSQ